MIEAPLAAVAPFCAGGVFEFGVSNTPVYMDVKGCTVTWLSAGKYRVDFSTPMPNNYYGVLVSGRWGGADIPGSNQGPVVQIDRGYDNATTVDHFYLLCETNNASGVYDSRVYFAVYKNAAALLGLAG